MSPSRTLSQYVLKVHSRCDLACDHCYVYEHADQSWRTRPRAMARETVRAAATRIAEHAIAHRLPRARVILHGGEPLLLGPARLRETLHELRATIGAVTRLDLRIQTNGVLLSPAVCDLLAHYDVRVGVSLDGDRAANDRHRRFADGRSSHDAVLRALALLRRPGYRRIYAGILCTIDVRNDPIQVYEALLAEAPPRMDFLLPHATWDQPPYRPAGDPTPYANWLRRIFERWLADGRPVPVRLFDSLLSAASGGPSGTEAIGLDPADLAVIETDGSWEQVDSLKTAYHGAAGTGFDVFTHPVDVVAGHPGIVQRQGGRDSLCRTCQDCPVVDRCGGGLFPHRYRSGNGFANPSVYCADLKELITAMDQHPIPPAPVTDGAGAGGTAWPVTASDAVPTATGSEEAPVLDQIGSGYGDEATIDFLAESQLSITRALVVAARDSAPTAGPVARLVAQAWDLLGRLEAEAPAAVDAVLTHPFVRVWAVRCLRPEGAARPGDPRDPASGPATHASGPNGAVAYLACLAAAVAVRAGVAAELPVPVFDGLLHLPTLGRFALAEPDATMVTLTTGTGAPADDPTAAGGTDFILRGPRGDGDGPGRRPEAWQPVRRIDRDGLPLWVEESDPYRACFDWPAAERLPDPALGQLARTVVGAWRAVQREVPGQLPGMRGAQRVLVPLTPDPGGADRAATARHAFGAVAVAPVARADELAVLLVHELQHAKLSAVLERYDLVDPHYAGRLRVPWRPDPRPVEGVLHGTYAHLAVADVWRARAAADDGVTGGSTAAGDDAAAENAAPANGGAAAVPGGSVPRAEALQRYHRYRDWTLGALDELLATGALTAAGARFAARMRETVESWPPVGRTQP